MQEVPLFPLWVTVFLAIWSVVGPIVGLLAGHFLSASSERKRWIADNEKEEYRKLLATFTNVNIAMLDVPGGKANLSVIHAALSEVSRACGTFIFIDDFLRKSKVVGELHAATKFLINGGDFTEYQKKYWGAVNEIINSARKIRA